MRTLLGLIFSEGPLRAIGTVSLILLAALSMFWIFSLFRVTVASVPSGSLDQFVPTPQNIPPPKPRDGLSLKDQVVGIYELKEKKGISRQEYLGTGIMAEYYNDKKFKEYNWEIINGAVHNEYEKGGVYILNINPDGSLTVVAAIDRDGKRTDYPVDKQLTYKKIPKGPVKKSPKEPVGGLPPAQPVQPTFDPGLPSGKKLVWTKATIEFAYKGKSVDLLPKNFGKSLSWKKQGNFVVYVYDKMYVKDKNMKYSKVSFTVKLDSRVAGGGRIFAVNLVPNSATPIRP